MKNFVILFLALLFVAGCSQQGPRFILDGATVIRGQNRDMISTPQQALAEQLEKVSGRKWIISSSDLIDTGAATLDAQADLQANSIFFRYCHSCKPGEFIIDVSQKYIIVQACDEAGFMNAAQNFAELLARDKDDVLFVPIHPVPDEKAKTEQDRPKFWQVWKLL